MKSHSRGFFSRLDPSAAPTKKEVSETKELKRELSTSMVFPELDDLERLRKTFELLMKHPTGAPQKKGSDENEFTRLIYDEASEILEDLMEEAQAAPEAGVNYRSLRKKIEHFIAQANQKAEEAAEAKQPFDHTMHIRSTLDDCLSQVQKMELTYTIPAPPNTPRSPTNSK
jgi:hypothetical protein